MKPEYFTHEEYQNRYRKLNELKEMGVIPYPHAYQATETSQKLHQRYEKAEVGHSEDAALGKTPQVIVSGRLVLFRAMGKNAFGHIQDHEGRIQVMFNRDLTELVGYANTETPALKVLEKKIDLGDILGIEGNLFHTNKGELTIYAKKVTLLCKTLLPLADKHSGLADVETRYRKRWLDLISNPEIQLTFRQRSKILKIVRKFLEEKEFLEVETPVLQSIYGGADARPFVTELHALHQAMFLRISLEIPLKKLIIGGMDKVFEIGRVFRNEGIDRNHNPEFTLLEAYAANWDYHAMMALMEQMCETIAKELYGTTEVPAKGPNEEAIVLNMKAPWPRLTMHEAIVKYGNLNVDTLSDEQMKTMLRESGHILPEKLKTMSRGLLIAALFEVYAEPHLIQPHHVIDHPIETTPLCKPHRNPELQKKGLVERFESYILGHEICNAYSEMNDPVIQRELLELQAARREAGDEEAAPLDEEFLEAICQGMPPTGGIGVGMDRLVMIMTNNHTLRDVLLFPWMKPKEATADVKQEVQNHV